jgi:DNA-binding CsgD family transcriptional regulator
MKRRYPASVTRQANLKWHILLSGAVGGILVAALRWMDYRFLVMDYSLSLYGGLVAVTFAVVGIWLGARLSRPPQRAQVHEPVLTAALPFVVCEQKRADLGITPREMEILALVAEGLSNREIAAKLFVSENTVKTHCSRAFDKLGAKRRTQAVQLGKELGLLG